MTKPATDEEVAEIRAYYLPGSIVRRVLARFDAERARAEKAERELASINATLRQCWPDLGDPIMRINEANAAREAAEAKLATALAFVAAFDRLVSAIEEAGEDGGSWDADPLWGPVIRARAALDDTGGGDAPSAGGEG